MQETWVQALGNEDPLEKRMVTYSSILAWRSPWTEEIGGLQSRGSKRVGHNRVINTHTHINFAKSCFQFHCLEVFPDFSFDFFIDMFVS